MTQPLSNIQRVGAYLLGAGHAVYLLEIIAGTRLTKNQAASALTSFIEWDIVEGVGTASPGRARRFIVRDRAELQARVDNPNRHGGGTVAGRLPDFGPLIACLGPV